MSEVARRQPFLEHIKELRGRITWCVVALLVGTTIGYFIKDKLLAILVDPLGQPLYYTSPGGGFSLIIQLCLGFGVIFAVPVLIFHLIRFLAPVLPGYSLKSLVATLLASCLLIAGGVAFAYFISLPAALYFLNEFSNDQVQALITTDTYLSFITLYLAGFAVLFQLPLLLLIINTIKPLAPRRLLAHTKWVILASFVIAAIITPTPDPFNQTIMAGPVVVLYLASILLIKIVNRKRKAVKEGPRNEQAARISKSVPREFDTSHLTLSRQQKTTYKQREGELHMWKYTDQRSDDVIVTFLYQGRHEFVKTYDTSSLKNARKKRSSS